jgi:hypothetical protein
MRGIKICEDGVVRKDIAIRGEREGYFHIADIEIPSVSLDYIFLKKRANDPVIRAFCQALMEIWDIDPTQLSRQLAG